LACQRKKENQQCAKRLKFSINANSIFYMETNRRLPRVVCAERLCGDLVVTFEDGSAALYSAALLYAILPQAEAVPPAHLDDE
jgi:hypothetical protein